MTISEPITEKIKYILSNELAKNEQPSAKNAQEFEHKILLTN